MRSFAGFRVPRPLFAALALISILGGVSCPSAVAAPRSSDQCSPLNVKAHKLCKTYCVVNRCSAGQLTGTKRTQCNALKKITKGRLIFKYCRVN